MEGTHDTIDTSMAGEAPAIIAEQGSSPVDFVLPEEIGTDVAPLDDSQNPLVMDGRLFEKGNEAELQAQTAAQVEMVADERAIKLDAAYQEEMQTASVENREFLYGEVDPVMVANQEADMVADAIENSVREGKIPGVSEENLVQPGFMENFLESPAGKRVARAFKAMVLATAMLAPMKSNAQGFGGYGEIAGNVAREQMTIRGNAERDAMNRENDIRREQRELESNLQLDKMRMDQNHQNRQAQINNDYRNELNALSSTGARDGDPRFAPIHARFQGIQNNFVTQVQQERANFEMRAQERRTRVELNAQARRERDAIKIQNDQSQAQQRAQTDMSRQFQQGIFNRRR